MVRSLTKALIYHILGIFFFVGFIIPANGQTFRSPEKVFSGTWGTATNQIGLQLAAPDMPPQGPFMGPGGFRVDSDESIWFSDSVQGAIKHYVKGRGESFPVAAKKLGDLFVTPENIYLCSLEPQGINVYEKKSGKLLRVIPVPFRTPGRLLVADNDHIAVEETGGGLWIIVSGKPVLHQAEAMEPVGDSANLYGTLFDFDLSSRKIIKAGWDEKTAEPTLFALPTFKGRKIAFSRLIGATPAGPWASWLLASSPSSLTLTRFKGDGKVDATLDIPLLSACYMSSTLIVGNDGRIYGFQSDLMGFSVYRVP